MFWFFGKAAAIKRDIAICAELAKMEAALRRMPLPTVAACDAKLEILGAITRAANLLTPDK